MREQDAPEDSLRSPTDDIYVEYLMSKRRESSDLDFKLTIDISRHRFPEVVKDIFAMANNGGGYLLIGFKESDSGALEPVGLPPEFHIDQATIQQNFNAYCPDPLDIGYREFDFTIENMPRKFALVRIAPSRTTLAPKVDGF